MLYTAIIADAISSVPRMAETLEPLGITEGPREQLGVYFIDDK